MTVLTTMACTISAAGISRPSFADILETLQAKFKAIYGSDAYIDPDSQDGQLLAAVAHALDDANAATVAAYASYSPATALGTALSSQVKINGIARAVPTKSTADVTLVGTVGTEIVGGTVSDLAGNRWLLPTTTIPLSGTVVVTATAEFDGAISASVGTITRIDTPILGWQSATNLSAAALGAAVETDAALRQRQAFSTALPSRNVLDGILGGVLSVSGVSQARLYENDTNSTDSNGLPAHSIAAVVLGGDDAEIAETILVKKTPGCFTQGSTVMTGIFDPAGIGPYTIRFYRPTEKRILMGVTVKAKTGYTTSVGVAIKQALADWVNGLGIGKSIELLGLAWPAQLSGDVSKGYGTFELTILTQSISPAALAAADVTIGFNEIANLVVGDIVLTVV